MKNIQGDILSAKQGGGNLSKNIINNKNSGKSKIEDKSSSKLIPAESIEKSHISDISQSHQNPLSSKSLFDLNSTKSPCVGKNREESQNDHLKFKSQFAQKKNEQNRVSSKSGPYPSSVTFQEDESVRGSFTSKTSGLRFDHDFNDFSRAAKQSDIPSSDQTIIRGSSKNEISGFYFDDRFSGSSSLAKSNILSSKSFEDQSTRKYNNESNSDHLSFKKQFVRKKNRKNRVDRPILDHTSMPDKHGNFRDDSTRIVGTSVDDILSRKTDTITKSEGNETFPGSSMTKISNLYTDDHFSGVPIKKEVEKDKDKDSSVHLTESEKFLIGAVDGKYNIDGNFKRSDDTSRIGKISTKSNDHQISEEPFEEATSKQKRGKRRKVEPMIPVSKTYMNKRGEQSTHDQSRSKSINHNFDGDDESSDSDSDDKISGKLAHKLSHMFWNDDLLGNRDVQDLSFENSSAIHPIKNDFKNNKNVPQLQKISQKEGNSPGKSSSEPVITNNQIDHPLRSNIGYTRSNDDFPFNGESFDKTPLFPVKRSIQVKPAEDDTGGDISPGKKKKRKRKFLKKKRHENPTEASINEYVEKGLDHTLCDLCRQDVLIRIKRGSHANCNLKTNSAIEEKHEYPSPPDTLDAQPSNILFLETPTTSKYIKEKSELKHQGVEAGGQLKKNPINPFFRTALGTTQYNFIRDSESSKDETLTKHVRISPPIDSDDDKSSGYIIKEAFRSKATWRVHSPGDNRNILKSTMNMLNRIMTSTSKTLAEKSNSHNPCIYKPLHGPHTSNLSKSRFLEFYHSLVDLLATVFIYVTIRYLLGRLNELFYPNGCLDCRDRYDTRIS